MSKANVITPTNPRLAKLLADVANGNIKVPVFQREYVWDDEQIMSLLDSIYRGYPVGSLLLWSSNVQLDYNRNVGGFKLPETPEDYPVLYVLDGQQRLTTLYGVFNSSSETGNEPLARRFNVCYNPESDEFIHASLSNDEVALNLRVIFNTTELLTELTRFSEEQRSKIARMIDKFKDYEFPVVTIRERTNQEVCRIFQRINSSGVRLSTLELLSAWTWSDEFDLRREIDNMLDRLSEKGYGDLDSSLVMRCIAAIVVDRIDPDTLVDIEPEKLVAGMTALKESIYATIDFLDKSLFIRNIVFLPFPIMIVPLVCFFSTNRRPTAEQYLVLRKWFWHCAFTQKYKRGYQ